VPALTSLTLVLRGSEITSLAELEKLPALTALGLDLHDSEVTNLPGLEKLIKLKGIWLDANASALPGMTNTKVPWNITELTIDASSKDPLVVPPECKIVGVFLTTR